MAIGGKIGKRERAPGGMIKVQPERQEEYGRVETEGIAVFGGADDDHGAEFAAEHYGNGRASRDRKARGVGEASGKGA
jgi:hypothetical protein